MACCQQCLRQDKHKSWLRAARICVRSVTKRGRSVLHRVEGLRGFAHRGWPRHRQRIGLKPVTGLVSTDGQGTARGQIAQLLSAQHEGRPLHTVSGRNSVVVSATALTSAVVRFLPEHWVGSLSPCRLSPNSA